MYSVCKLYYVVLIRLRPGEQVHVYDYVWESQKADSLLDSQGVSCSDPGSVN